MAGKILLEVVTPEKQLLSQQVDEVIAPGSEGEFGVLPGHCHFLSTLRIGELRYRVDSQTHSMAVLWGFAEVTPTKVTIMAEIAEQAEDIDVERATAKVAEAERSSFMISSCVGTVVAWVGRSRTGAEIRWRAASWELPRRQPQPNHRLASSLHGSST